MILYQTTFPLWSPWVFIWHQIKKIIALLFYLEGLISLVHVWEHFLSSHLTGSRQFWQNSEQDCSFLLEMDWVTCNMMHPWWFLFCILHGPLCSHENRSVFVPHPKCRCHNKNKRTICWCTSIHPWDVHFMLSKSLKHHIKCFNYREAVYQYHIGNRSLNVSLSFNVGYIHWPVLQLFIFNGAYSIPIFIHLDNLCCHLTLTKSSSLKTPIKLNI